MAKPIDPELIRLRRELDKARAALTVSRAAKPDDVETIVESELAAAKAKLELQWLEDAYQRRFSVVLSEQLRK
jgi:hypothetical protein